MQKFFDTIIDTSNGEAIPGVEVWVYNQAGHTPAALFDDPAGTIIRLNPLTTDSNGLYWFHAADGRYQLEYHSPEDGSLLETIPNVAVVDLAELRDDVDGLDARFTNVEQSVSALGAAVASSAAAYRYGGAAPSEIVTNEILMDHVVVDAHTLPANLAGSKASVGSNPTANPWVATLKQNGATVATISVASTGVVTLATTGGLAIAVAVGDVMSLHAPTAVDGTIARFRWTFRGTVG